MKRPTETTQVAAGAVKKSRYGSLKYLFLLEGCRNIIHVIKIRELKKW